MQFLIAGINTAETSVVGVLVLGSRQLLIVT